MKGLFSTLATIWRLASPYFYSEDRWAGRMLLAAVIVIELSIVAINVLLNPWNNRFYNALQDRNWDAFVISSRSSACLPAFLSCSPSISSISINGCRSAGGTG